IEPQVINQPGAQSDSESIASKGPDVPPDSAEEPETAPAAGEKKTKSKNGTKNKKHVRPRQGRSRSTFHSSSAANKFGVWHICHATRSFDSTEDTWPQTRQRFRSKQSNLQLAPNNTKRA